MKAAPVLLLLVGGTRLVSGDWLVLADGARSEVERVEVLERSVRVTTLAGKTWIVLKAAVDLDATRRANVSGIEAERGVEPAPPDPPTLRTPVPPPATPRPAPPAPAPPAPPPEPPPSPPAAESTPVRARGAVEPHRVAFFLNGATGQSPAGFSQSRGFELFNETASVDTRYESGSTRGVEVGAVVRLAGPLAVGASFDVFEIESSARYTALLPHPFFYDRFRTLGETRSGLVHRQRALHVGPVLALNIGPRLSVDLYGGASRFLVEVDAVDGVSYEEAFPFESVIPQGSTLRRLQAKPWGYHLGASSTFRIGGIFGVDITLRYSRADVALTNSQEREIPFEAGGLRIGTGLRFLFP